MERDFKSVSEADLRNLSATVGRAGHDWPAKRDTLETRLRTLRQSLAEANSVWGETADARQHALSEAITGPQLASLIEASETLSRRDQPSNENR